MFTHEKFEDHEKVFIFNDLGGVAMGLTIWAFFSVFFLLNLYESFNKDIKLTSGHPLPEPHPNPNNE